MKRNIFIILAFFLTLYGSSGSSRGNNAEPRQYYPLFILSGQSNMQLLDIGYFLPIIEETFGPGTIAVKDTLSGQSITNWYDKYDLLAGDGDGDPVGWFYYLLKRKIFSAIGNKNIRDVFFIWMQGERDAREELGDVYENQLEDLYKQLCRDINRKDIFFVIGRLSDFDMENEKYPHWTMIRDIQEKVAESKKKFDWVDTDDLNDGLNRRGDTINNDLHMSAEGYKTLGSRFAKRAIDLINN